MPATLEIPVFPLPDVVFFPKTVLPLHVFETRYRKMVKDALSRDRTIAVALLQPGWEQRYEGSPAYFPIATVGRMEEIETTRDGRYYFKLSGLVRVRLGQVVNEAPYRLVLAKESPEVPVDEADPSIRRAKLELLASQVSLVQELTGNDSPKLILDERITFEAAVNAACACLPAEAAIRQSLLAEDDLVLRYRRAAGLLDEILQRVIRLKSKGDGNAGAAGVN
jgi:Lon protease-like protein